MYDIVVIGGGPAGLTAALYALRAEKTVLVLEGSGFGGQIVYTNEVENFPGIMKMRGVEFADTLLEQVMNAGGEVGFEKVLSIHDGKIKTVVTDSGEHEAKAIIAATGVKHRRLGVVGEEKFIGRGVSFCAVCDGAFHKGRTVAVIGGGNTAVEDAIYLSGIAEKVFLIHRRNEFRAEPSLVRQMNECSNIEPVLSATVSGFFGEDSLKEIEVTNLADSSTRRISVSGAFVAVGQIPQNEIFDGIINLDSGYIAAGEDCLTNIDGIFAAGDCRTKSVRQLTTAVGDGAAAAVTACEYISHFEE